MHTYVPISAEIDFNIIFIHFTERKALASGNTYRCFFFCNE